MADLSDHRCCCRGNGCSVGAKVALLNRAMRRTCRIDCFAVDDVTKYRSSRWMTSTRLLLATMLVLSWCSNWIVLAEGYEHKTSENNGCTAAKQAIGEHIEMSAKMMPG